MGMVNADLIVIKLKNITHIRGERTEKGLLIQSGGIREGFQEEVIPELNFEGQVGLS